MAPTLSIICPTFNRAGLLRECVESIFSRGGQFEVIIADDGSTDETPVVCGELQATYGTARVVITRSDANLGAPCARNRGMAQASGGCMMFVDSDDVLASAGIAALLERLSAKPELDYAFGKVIRADAQLKALPAHAAVGMPFSNDPVEIAGYHWHTMGAIYRRAYLKKVGPWNESLTGSQDWEYQARVKLAGGRVDFVDEVVGWWRQHEGNRVGTAAFRPDYVRSVMYACASILMHAREVGRCDGALERRLAKKLVIHALEWGANECPKERRQCLEQAAETVTRDPYFRIMIRALQLAPPVADGWLRGRLTKRTPG